MNGMNKNTRRVDDIIRAFNEFDEEAVNDYYSVGENGNFSETETYEVDLGDNELFSADIPKSYSNDSGLEGAAYYNPEENYGFEDGCNDEATYRTDNEDNYYTESVSLDGNCSETETYEVDLKGNELFSADTPKSYSNDLGLEGAAYYNSQENYGFESVCNDEAIYRTDNEDNYYTESMSLVGNDSVDYCNEPLSFKESNSVDHCDESFSDGIEEGYSEGYEEGIAEGKNSKCQAAYDRGYCNGFQDGYEKAKQEVLDYVNARRKERNCCKKKCCCKRRCCCKRSSCC